MDINAFMAEFERSLKPYRKDFINYSRLPQVGRDREEILQEMRGFNDLEEGKWKDGLVSGAVYHGDPGHIAFQNEVYALNSQSNPLHFDVWPSATKYEAEIVSMTAHMLNAEQAGDKIVGTVSSGGTESILLAMKTYRDWSREKRWITEPEMIAPTTAHAAFDKASQFFNIKMIRVPVDENLKADVEAVRAAITRNTAVIVGSAPQFPHGIIDPIEELSELARENGIGFHTDACLGGFMLPWAEKLGYDVPPFDFRLPGVTSMSADTHKYGYAAKGTSVVLYRGEELRRYQYYLTTSWPGGLYLSPTLAGSRPGALSAECWAAMLSIGEQGYLDAARRILEAADVVKQGLAEIPELHVLGDPLWVIAFASDSLDIYAVSDYMTQKGWSLNGLQRPPCLHIALTLRHTQPGLVERFLADLREAVDYVKAHPSLEGSMGPIYGMAGNVALGSAVNDILKYVLDILYKV
jgi:glutamate/tyrosine decarboxylase-like PLP-dependent enzyme